MTENAYTSTDTTDDTTTDVTDAVADTMAADLADRATWAVNSLLEAGEDALAVDLAETYEAELRYLPRRAPRHLRKAG